MADAVQVGKWAGPRLAKPDPASPIPSPDAVAGLRWHLRPRVDRPERLLPSDNASPDARVYGAGERG